MNTFKWTNKDVVDKLQARKDGKISDADAICQRQLQQNRKEITEAELKSKFGGTMLAVRNGQEYRAFMLWRRTTYQCTDCFNIRKKLNLKFLLPLVTKSEENSSQTKKRITRTAEAMTTKR
uniref:Uncharacterized protein n=1 Tax=Ditylenchus dipsaci TaxID=166011 RepID=A0A915CN98_9BILA